MTKPSKRAQRAEFETFITELMKVDPAGLSGKHKAEKAKATKKKAPPPK